MRFTFMGPYDIAKDLDKKTRDTKIAFKKMQKRLTGKATEKPMPSKEKVW